MPTGRPVIAHVLHRLDRAGAEVLAAGLARSLRDRFEFVFFCLDGLGPLAEELADDGFAVHALDRSPGIDRKLRETLRQTADRHDVALIHAHQYTPFFYSALARGTLINQEPRLAPSGIVFTEHGRHYPDTRSLKRVLANKLLLRKRDHVTAVGQFVKDALICNEGIAAKRIDVIYNGIDPGPEPTANDRTAARQQLGIDPDRPVVMQVARFHPVKDHATAIRAWAQVHQASPDALLVFIGDGEQRAPCEQLARDLGLQDAVRFTGVRPDARALIPAADLCLLTSLSEGVSVTLLEAMAAAKPVIATDVGGNPEVVAHNTTGILIPRGDHEALARAIEPLLANAAYAQRTLGNAGRARLLERFTADRMHDQYARLYQSLVAPT